VEVASGIFSIDILGNRALSLFWVSGVCIFMGVLREVYFILH
jgi:hypothetical protein